MDINWDDIAAEADNTPAAMLSEVIGKVNVNDEVIIITCDERGLQTTYHLTETMQNAIAMLELAKIRLLMRCVEATGGE